LVLKAGVIGFPVSLTRFVGVEGDRELIEGGSLERSAVFQQLSLDGELARRAAAAEQHAAQGGKPQCRGPEANHDNPASSIPCRTGSCRLSLHSNNPSSDYRCCC